ncbi:methyltransferase type 12 [Pseudomonas oryzihabitans]|uniref:Methyltransferase type 12 n=1 Tax=Pseudomonas oryzihabitans TaxID=47885 RepID=A0A0U4HI27_9PSED|nr:methyltransferase type 12 [Pseudomonas oryzihabitans]
MRDGQRVQGEIVEIDYAATQAFFERRGRQHYQNALSATMYQDNDPGLVAYRDEAEKAAIGMALCSPAPRSVLDIGCGIGRWGWYLADRHPEIDYLGIDFSSSLIAKAHEGALERGYRRLKFQTMSATAIDSTRLELTPPYDLLIVSGLLIYLNDADCLKMLTDLGSLCSSATRFYLREPIALEKRLTLDAFFSSELQDRYSAIYRTLDELKVLLSQAFPAGTLAVDQEGFLFEDSLEKRVETRQYYLILSMKDVQQ